MRHLLAAGVALLLSLGLTVALMPEDAPAEESSRLADGSAPLAPLDPATLAGIRLDAPAWRPGNAWSVTFEPSGFACDLVVVEAEDRLYRQASACDGGAFLATEDAVFDYPFMGELGPGLEGLQSDAPPVVFYDWPLAHGKRWTTEWNGAEVDVVAEYARDLPGARGAVEPGFRLAMSREGEAFATYDYRPSLGWWSELRLASGFVMAVKDFEPDWHGEAYLSQVMPRLVVERGTLDGAPRPFQVPEGDDMLLVLHEPGSDPRFVALLDPDGELAYQDLRAPFTGGNPPMTYLESKPGQWTAMPAWLDTGRPAFHVHGVRFVQLSL